MSLYCGKVGRALVRHSVSNTFTGKILGKTANTIGKFFSKCTFGHYRIGLTRKAFELSQQLNIGATINFQDGKITDKTGSILYEDQLLRIDQDMGEVIVRQPMTTPEGMARFLRYVYFRPKQWRINVSDSFSAQEKTDITSMIDRINSILGIRLDNGISLNVCQLTLKNRLAIGFSNGFSRGILASTLFTIPNMIRAGTIFPSGSTLLTLASIICMLGIQFAFVFRGIYLPSLHLNPFFTTKNGSIYFKRSDVFAHEYIHFLKDFGFIGTDIIANTFSTFEELRLYGKSTNKEWQENYEFGKRVSPHIVVSRASLRTLFLGSETGYTTGSRLAGLADQLVERSGDPEIKNRFLRIVANTNTREDLVEILQEDPELRLFFNPLLDLLSSLKK